MKRVLYAALLGLGVLSGSAQAQTWPTKPVTLVVPFPAGGSSDSIARSLGPKLHATFGQAFVVDNKPGASGTIGAAQVKRAAPDGYTFLVTSLAPLVTAPHLLKSIQYNALKDFDYVTVAVQAPNVLVVPTNSPHQSMADVVAFMKANPGKMTFGSSGVGSSDHLTAALFWQETGTKASHIPYKGGAPVMTDLIGAQIDASFQNINAVLPQLKAGKLKALAITSATRSAMLPNIPTLNESGVQNVDVYSWQGIAAPKGIPVDVRDKFYKAVLSGLNDPQVKETFTSLGFEVVGNTPEQFTAFQQQEFARWKKVIETGNITAE